MANWLATTALCNSFSLYLGLKEQGAFCHGSKKSCSPWEWEECVQYGKEGAKMAETPHLHASVPALPAASIIRSLCSGLSDEFPQQRTNSPEATLVFVSITVSPAPPSSLRRPQGQHHRPARSPQTTEELPEEPVHHTHPWSRPHAGIVPGLSHPTDAVDGVHTPWHSSQHFFMLHSVSWHQDHVDILVPVKTGQV